MTVFLVTYDLNKETSRPNIVKSIREDFDGFAKLSESSYAIDTGKTSQEVFNALKKHIDSNDDLLVITLRKPYAGQNSKAVIDWLDSSLLG